MSKLKVPCLLSLSLLAFITIQCKREFTTTSVVEQHPITIDAQITSYYPNSNQGSNSLITPQAWTVSGILAVQRAYLNVDLSLIPSSARITSAKLILRADTVANYTGNVVYGHSNLSGSNQAILRRVTSPWSENTITWNTRPSTDDVNAIIIPASSSKGQIYTIDITRLVQDQYENPSSYFGFCIQLDDENPYRSLIFGSSDSPRQGLSPLLSLIYKMPD